MIDTYDELYRDFETVNRISIIPTMLDVICQTTGMGYAVVVRVTEDRWLACSVRDEVKFGLKAGEELKLETTLCSEVRGMREPIIIDHVDFDEAYKTHHTPKMYGLQSYISYPIVLKDGSFFGTLCAIDSKPAQLKNKKVMGTFEMFAELLAFHLQSLDLMERSHFALKYSNDENEQYKQVTNHNLQEPLRKIKVYSNYLADKAAETDLDGLKKIGVKINAFAEEVSTMIEHINRFSELNNKDVDFETVDLNESVANVCAELEDKLHSKNIELIVDDLPSISAIPLQMEQFFYQLLNYAITFTAANSSSVLRIFSKEISPDEIKQPLPEGKNFTFCNVFIEQHSSSLDSYYLNNIFDIFVHLNGDQKGNRYGAGLAYCRKIIQNHGGIINAEVIADLGVSFSIVLPVDNKSKVLNW